MRVRACEVAPVKQDHCCELRRVAERRRHESCECECDYRGGHCRCAREIDAKVFGAEHFAQQNRPYCEDDACSEAATCTGRKHTRRRRRMSALIVSLRSQNCAQQCKTYAAPDGVTGALDCTGAFGCSVQSVQTLAGHRAPHSKHCCGRTVEHRGVAQRIGGSSPSGTSGCFGYGAPVDRRTFSCAGQHAADHQERWRQDAHRHLA